MTIISVVGARGRRDEGASTAAGRRTGRLATVVGCVLALAACDDATPHAAPQMPPPEVGVLTVTPERVVLTTELPGRTAPYRIAEVRPQVGGIIQKRLFKEGSEIKAGDLLYQIDPATYQASYDAAKASLDKAEATLSSLELKAKRYKQLSSIKAVSQQDYDDADASLKQAQAEIAANKASLETARINLDYTRVTSPISGRIGKSAASEGALVTAGQSTTLATVQQLDPIYVDVTQSATDAMRLRRALSEGRLKEGGSAKVKLILEDGTPYPLEGSLEFSDVTVDETTGAITMRALFPNPEFLLLPGMYVRAITEDGVYDAAILLPQRAVTRDSKGDAIAYFVEPDGKIGQHSLTLSRAIGDRWLVLDGASAGDRLIVDGIQKVRPGMAPTVVDLAAGSAPAGGSPAAPSETGEAPASAAPATAAPAGKAPAGEAPTAASPADDAEATDAGPGPKAPTDAAAEAPTADGHGADDAAPAGSLPDAAEARSVPAGDPSPTTAN